MLAILIDWLFSILSRRLLGEVGKEIGQPSKLGALKRSDLFRYSVLFQRMYGFKNLIPVKKIVRRTENGTRFKS